MVRSSRPASSLNGSAQHQFHVNLVEAAGNVALRQHKIHQLPAVRTPFVELAFGHVGSFHHLVFPLLHAAV